MAPDADLSQKSETKREPAVNLTVQSLVPPLESQEGLSANVARGAVIGEVFGQLEALTRGTRTNTLAKLLSNKAQAQALSAHPEAVRQLAQELASLVNGCFSTERHVQNEALMALAADSLKSLGGSEVLMKCLPEESRHYIWSVLVEYAFEMKPRVGENQARFDGRRQKMLKPWADSKLNLNLISNAIRSLQAGGVQAMLGASGPFAQHANVLARRLSGVQPAIEKPWLDKIYDPKFEAEVFPPRR